EEWSKEFCEIFASEEEYLERGFGFGVVKDGKLVSGASTMTAYDGGIEVQVATDEHYQGRGYAMACAAALILECAKRGIRPCWDAANEASLHMALRLGYEYQGIYTTIQMSRNEQ
ncbi:MAG: GNAT family N-acetyltransferase, partial [Anaerolineaceae bacterium]|nr:GNAT family N-acetyltransferase [Anaerolineaceae bacterium]